MEKLPSIDLTVCRNPFNPVNFWLTALPYPEGVTGINTGALPGYSQFSCPFKPWGAYKVDISRGERIGRVAS